MRPTGTPALQGRQDVSHPLRHFLNIIESARRESVPRYRFVTTCVVNRPAVMAERKAVGGAGREVAELLANGHGKCLGGADHPHDVRRGGDDLPLVVALIPAAGSGVSAEQVANGVAVVCRRNRLHRPRHGDVGISHNEAIQVVMPSPPAWTQSRARCGAVQRRRGQL